MNEAKIIFSEKLAIDPNEFVTVWNDTPECRDIAEARLNQAAKTQFADPSLLAGIIEFVTGTGVEFAAGAIAGGVLHDGVKAAVEICMTKMKNKVIALKYKKIKQPDGSQLTKVLPEKKDNTPPSE
jgi:hypothetical protein